MVGCLELIDSCRRARASHERRQLRRVRVDRMQPEVHARRVEQALVVHDAHAPGRAIGCGWRRAARRARLQTQRTTIRRGRALRRGRRGAVVLLEVREQSSMQHLAARLALLVERV